MLASDDAVSYRVRPTISLCAPIAMSVSVALGTSETMRVAGAASRTTAPLSSVTSIGPDVVCAGARTAAESVDVLSPREQAALTHATANAIVNFHLDGDKKTVRARRERGRGECTGKRREIRWFDPAPSLEGVLRE
jgi:hypothetical protein